MRLLIYAFLSVQSLSGFDLRSDMGSAYQHQKWEEVELIAKKILSPLKTRDLKIPHHFGQVYFKLGVALWHQGKWDQASNAFETCYTKFHNRRENPNRLQALLGWSDSNNRAKKYASSLRIAKRFLREADAREWHRTSAFANGPRVLNHNPYFQ